MCLVLIAVVLSSVAGVRRQPPEDSGPSVSSGAAPARGTRSLDSTAQGEHHVRQNVSQVKFYCDSVDDAHLIGTVANPDDSLYTRCGTRPPSQNGDHALYPSPLWRRRSLPSLEDGDCRQPDTDRTIAAAVTGQAMDPQTDAHPPVLRGTPSPVLL